MAPFLMFSSPHMYTGDRWRVVLTGETSDYIHATNVNVRECVHKNTLVLLLVFPPHT